MCGRFYIAPEKSEIKQIVGHIQLPLIPDLPIKTEGEIFPTNIVAVLALEDGHSLAKPMIWGFPSWTSPKSIINARAETALEKPMFRKSLTERWVAILTTGFFEWKTVPGQKQKEKYLFRIPGQGLLYLAGFWNSFPVPKDGPITEHFTILTTEANESMRPYHDRMPVIIGEDELMDWLKGKKLDDFLVWEQAELEAVKWD